LIVFRFISIFAEKAEIESLKTNLDIGGEEFTFKRKRTSHLGWLEHYPYQKVDDDDFIDFKKGDNIKVKKVRSEEKETKPPGRYNEASLIKELEKRELGTKATRADIIAKLYDREYISGKKIEVNTLGESIIDTLKQYSENITSEELTRSFEKDLDRIENEKITKDKVIDNAKEEVQSILDDIEKNEDKIADEIYNAYQQSRIVGKCVCGGDLAIKYSPKNKSTFIGCSNFPDCKTAYPLPRGAFVLKSKCEKCGLPMIAYGRPAKKSCLDPKCGKENEDLSPEVIGECPKCGSDLLKRHGRYGDFVGCSNFPKCKYTSSIANLEANKDNPETDKADLKQDTSNPKINKADLESK
jgi:DNA topoisomerase-1